MVEYFVVAVFPFLQTHTLSPVPPIFIDKNAIRNVLDKSKTFRSQLNRKAKIFGCIGVAIGVAWAVIKMRTR